MTDGTGDDGTPTGAEPLDQAGLTAAQPDTYRQLDTLWDDPPGLMGRLRAVQNDKIGVRLIVTGFFFLLLGGSVDSFVMRLQLAVPENDIVSSQLYNELFTNHGSVTMFLVILPIFEGFSILLLPLLLGAREMPFPRLGAFAYWTFLMGGLLYYSSTLFQAVPDAGWFAYTPLSLKEYSPDLALDFWVLGLGVAEVGAIAAAIEIIIGVLKLRAPGMTLARMPLFAWAMLITSFMILFAFTPLIVGSLLLELERGFGMQFFTVDRGGSSLLWQHLFWIFGHPEVYIQFLPATGVISMVLPVMVRRRISGYIWMVAAMVAIGFLSFGLWAHHMFTVGLPTLVLAFFAASSMMIAIPAGVQIFSWLATIWAGRARWHTPFLFVVGFLFIFVAGGITGVMTAAVPLDQQVHDSYFVVAHLHYVLIGGVAFPMFAGVYYWLPKYTGYLLNERLGRWNFWLLFVGVNVTFFPMHLAGLAGMPRRISTYSAESGWAVYNLISSLGVLLIIPGLGLFIANLIYSRYRGRPVGPNPWGGDSLEWAVPSPPLQHGWSVPPIVTSRHPLWDQDELHRGEPGDEALVHALAQWPLRWRAALVVNTSTARPEEVFRVAGPSIWPLVAAFGMVGVFASELFGFRWGIALSVAVIAVAVVIWNRPVEAPMTLEEEYDFEAAHGVPVRASGSVTIARWAMGLVILFVAIAFGSFLLSYFYLRLENTQWPPPGVPLPEFGPAVASALPMVVGLIALVAGRQAGRRGAQTYLVAGLGAAVALGALSLGGYGAELARFTYTPQDHAYGSIVFTLAGFAVAVGAVATLMSAAACVYAVQGTYRQHRLSPVDNVVRFYTAATVVWLVSLAVLTLGPRLT